MADKEVAIKIPNWLYNAIMECKEPHYSKSLGDAVRDGTPLPKGHGRLIDADKLLETWYDDFCKFMAQTELNSMNNIIKNAPTVIEADKEVEK